MPGCDNTPNSRRERHERMRTMAKSIEPCYRLLGAKVEQMRSLLGWTQGELAGKIGLTRTSIANLEAGRQRVLMHDIEKIAAAFQSTPKAILRGIWT